MDILTRTLAQLSSTAFLIYLIKVIIQDKKDKRAAINDLIQYRFRDRGWVKVEEPQVFETPPGLGKERLLKKIYITFNGSWIVRRCLQEFEKAPHNKELFNKLLKAMCWSAWMPCNKFLLDCGNGY